MHLTSHGSIRTLRQDMQESFDGKTYQGVETVDRESPLAFIKEKL